MAEVETAAEEIEVKADTEEVVEDMEKEEEEEVLEARDPNESIPFVNIKEDASSLQHGDLVNYNEKMFRVTKIALAAQSINF